MTLKDRWNSQGPSGDAQFAKYYTSPVLAKIVNTVYPPLVDARTTGRADLEGHYTSVRAWQETRLRPTLENLDRAIVRSSLGRYPRGIYSEFRTLWSLGEVEQSQVDQARAALVASGDKSEQQRRALDGLGTGAGACLGRSLGYVLRDVFGYRIITGPGFPIVKAFLPVASSIIAVMAVIPRLFQPGFFGDGSRFVVMNLAPARIISTALRTISKVKFRPSPSTT